jgi:hypothetical protein
MAVESHSSLSGSSKFNNSRLELEGLESFFEEDQQEMYSRGLSLKQAVFYYSASRKSVRAKVLEGLIPAIRLPEAYGGKWRIFPDGVPPQLQELIPENLKNGQDKEINSRRNPDKPSNKKPKTETPLEDFSVPGIDCPGQLILQTAGFLVNETPPLEKPLPLAAPAADALAVPGDSTGSADGPSAGIPQGEVPAGSSLWSLPALISEPDPPVETEPEAVCEPIPAAPAPLGVTIALQDEVPTSSLGKDFVFSPATAGSASEFPASIISGVASLIRQDTPEALTMLALLQSIDNAGPHVQMLEKVSCLEKKLEDANYRNSYLETRLTGLEDQVRFLTQAHCQKRVLNDLLLVVPVLVLLALTLIFRFCGSIQL